MNVDLTGRQILHFRILERIGRGGMGAVFKAEDAQLSRIVALKFFPFYLTPGPEEVARFEREAKAAASANHPNLCTIYGFYSTPEFQFIAMEYVPGETLKRKLGREGPMSCDKALEILGRAAEALAAAHRQGVVHRDVKSDNIMLTPDGGVKVMDFGLATFRDAPSITKTGEILGTVAYMSPEQVEGKPVDCRTDLWSLGVVLYEMLTGDMPFQGDSDVTILQNILHARPRPVAEEGIRVWKSIRYILNTLMEKNVRYRYPNADRLIEDIHRKVRNSGLRLAWRAARKNALKCAVVFGLIITLGIAVYIPLREEAGKPSCLTPAAELYQLTSEIGQEHGSISPSGRYLAYEHDYSSIHIKDLTKDDVVLTGKGLPESLRPPVWCPDETGLVFPFKAESIHRWFVNWNRITWSKKETLLTVKEPAVFHLALSPDNRWMTYGMETMTERSLWLYSFQDSTSRCLARSAGSGVYFSAWHPDSRHIAYYDPRPGGSTAVIQTLDIRSGVASPGLAEVRHYPGDWHYCGLAFSPDGRYLVFPDSEGHSVQLFALRVSGAGMRADGRPKSFTRFSENQTPFWPCFDRAGSTLSFMIDEPVYEIDISPLDLDRQRIGTEMVPILTDKGRKSECEWSKDGRQILFVSQKGNQCDLYLWNRESQRADRLTSTSGDEHFPSFVPGGGSIGYLMNGAVYRIPLEEKLPPQKIFPPEPSNNPRTVYRYAWGLSADTLYAVVSPGPEEPQNHFPLIRVELREGREDVLCRIPAAIPPNIDIRRSPEGGKIAYRVRDSNNTWLQWIGVVDLATRKNRKVAEESSIVPNGELAWTPDGKSLFFRSNESDTVPAFRFYRVDAATGLKTTVSIPGLFMRCMPGQISAAGDEIIIYNARYETDVFALKTRPFEGR